MNQPIDQGFVDGEAAENARKRARAKADLEAIKRDADQADAARKANDDFRQANRERAETVQWMEGFHSEIVEPKVVEMANGLGLEIEGIQGKIVEKDQSVKAVTAVTLKRKTAYDVKLVITTVAKINVGAMRRGFSVTIVSDKIISRGFFGQAIAKLKRQTRIAKSSKRFPLSDLQYDSDLSKLPSWFRETMKKMLDTHADLMASEGQ